MGKGFSRLFRKKEARILMVGLDAAGKTTILYTLQNGKQKVKRHTPTIGFNVEKIKLRGIKLSVWDLGGQDRLRSLWRHYYVGTHAVIYVVDSSDRARLGQARTELHNMLRDQLMSEALLLVFANKQDIDGCLTPEQVTEELGLYELKGRRWYVQPSVGCDGVGLIDGMAWLSEHLRAQQLD
nr:Arf6 [Planomonas micra]